MHNMLVIKNIQKLEHKTIGKWVVLGVDENKQMVGIAKTNYVIRLSRNNIVGGAIIIERKAGEYGYNVAVCYNEYNDVISLSPWPKDRLLGKDNFIASMQVLLDAEFDKRNN